MSRDEDSPTRAGVPSDRRAGRPVPKPVETIVTPVDAMAGSATDVEALISLVRDASDGRYDESGMIASGGMGTIDLVLDRSLHRRAVMKRIHEHLTGDARTVRMFVREAQLMGQLEHPNIVPVHELGLADGRTLYFTMKLVEGRTLLEVIRELPRGAIEHRRLLELLDVVVKVCDALAFAHSRGVIHCDVKPANIMVGDFGQVYLMDWGVARVQRSRDHGDDVRREPTSDVHPDLTRTTAGYLVGTPTHMAPEQALGKNTELDERTDVFAVGALIYHLLTRRPPFDSDSFWSSVSLAQKSEWPSIESHVGEGVVPKALSRIVQRAMERESHHRYPTIAELKDDLLRFVRGGDSFPAVSFRAGQMVISEGEPGDAAYIIQSGSCEAFRVVDGEKRVLRTMGVGEVFGEMAILAPGPRTASVVAVTDTTVHIVTADVLEQEVEGMKPWMGAFVRTLAQRFRERGG